MSYDKKSPFSRTTAHIFVSPGDAPAIITQYVAGVSRGETKMWAAVRESGDFFALAVQITGKLLNIDG